MYDTRSLGASPHWLRAGDERAVVAAIAPGNEMESCALQHHDDSNARIGTHSTEVSGPGRPYKILYTLREAPILDWSFPARGPWVPARRATRGRLPT